MKTYRILQVVSIAITIVGLALFVPFVYFWYRTAQAQPITPIVIPVEARALEPASDVITGKPSRLAIPSHAIDLSVVEGEYNSQKKTWTLSNDKAHFALPSMPPNNKEGNTLLYGHYRKEVFSRLHKIIPGSEVILTTDNGHRFVYVFRESVTVDPTNVDIFAYQGKPQLTIQTCSGTWFENRQLYYFDLKTVE